MDCRYQQRGQRQWFLIGVCGNEICTSILPSYPHGFALSLFNYISGQSTLNWEKLQQHFFYSDSINKPLIFSLVSVPLASIFAPTETTLSLRCVLRLESFETFSW
jgi:hypothetical protein